MCLYPKYMINRKYTSTKKNGGVVPTILDSRVKYVPIGCQQCMECRKQYARSWQLRMLEDIKENTNGKFITLTFSDEKFKEHVNIVNGNLDDKSKLNGYDLDNAVATKAVRLFLERWRKEYGISLRHFLITELGHEGTENIHLHGIVWTNQSLDKVEHHWKNGFVWKGKKKGNRIINYVSARTVNYIIKYVTKADIDHKGYKSKILCSKGIGSNYIDSYSKGKHRFNERKTNVTYKDESGRIYNMPIYWRNKLFSEAEREALWLHLLDRGERYVNGVKCRNYDDYWKLLKAAQEENKRLGYGGHMRDIEEIEYENKEEY